MQKHEVENSRLFFGLTLPVVGWVGAAFLGGIALSPGWEPIRAALHSTPHEPLLLGGLAVGGALALAMGWAMGEFGDDGFRGAQFRRHLRGTRMANWHTLKAKVLAANRQENHRRKKEKGVTALPPILIGPMPMPLHLETRNTLICAAPGAGKSLAIEHMIASATKRRDKMVIVDPNGSFYSKFGFPGDTVLNPFDTRGVGWTLFNEIKSTHDFDRMAKSIIPPQVDPNDEQWCSYARDVLADTIRKLKETGKEDMDILVNLLVREDGEGIRAFLANTDSQGYFRDNAEKAIASIQFMMNKYVRPLRYMANGQFSIYEWVHKPDSGNLFITWREDMRAAIRPLVATWIDTICATILSYEPMTLKRLWMFLDELESLGKLESFVPAATKGRKHGLRIVASLQDWSQLDVVYSRDSARTILACFRNYLILGASNALNADKASGIIGKQVVERVRISTNAGNKGGGRSRQLVASEPEFVVLDSEISNLPDLMGYVKFAEDFPVAKIKLPFVAYPIRNKAIEIK